MHTYDLYIIVSSMCHVVHVEARGQLGGVSSLIQSCGSRDWTQVARLSTKILCLMSYLVGPQPNLITCPYCFLHSPLSQSGDSQRLLLDLFSPAIHLLQSFLSSHENSGLLVPFNKPYFNFKLTYSCILMVPIVLTCEELAMEV